MHFDVTRRLSARRNVDQPDRKANGLEEGSPDHKTRHHLYGKPKGDRKEVTKLERREGQAHEGAPNSGTYSQL